MVKSRVEEVLSIFRCLFRDIGNTFPELRASLDLDFERLTRLGHERGLHIFCVDMPTAGKHLDRCVSEGKYVVTGAPLSKRCPKDVMYPQFLSGLWGLIFHEDGCLKEDCDVEALLLIRQVYYLAKKVKLDCPKDAVLEEVQAFFDADSGLPDPEEVWYTTDTFDEAYQGFSNSSLYQERVTQYPWGSVLLTNMDLVSAFVNSALGVYSPYEWKFRHGPGVVSERTGLVNKYQFVNWSDALEAEFPIADFGFYNHQSWARQALSSCIGDEDPTSRMIAVPKTLSGPRLIAAEPTEHMWCQQNIWCYIRSRVERCWIADFVRFTDQSRNQLLCKRASVSGSLATLDLSSASDRVTCQFVGQLFRSNPPLLRALRATRTRKCLQGINPAVPSTIVLKKFSTMGSACTFPVETLGFLTVALAACLTRRGLQVTLANLRSLREEVTIFGDDIIVPSDCREFVVNALEVFHFKVNVSKSFWSGCFRESCGVDAFRGVDITPVYWRSFAKDDPESVVSHVEVRNSFHKRGLWAVSGELTSTIPRRMIPTVRTQSGVFGLVAFAGPSISGFRRRWNRFLHRDEVECLGFSSRTSNVEIKDDSVLLQFFTENPEPHQPWAGGVAQKPKLRLSLGWYCVHDVVS